MTAARPQIEPEWLDAGLARRYLSLDLRTFNAATKTGRLPPPREVLPGIWRWSREELMQHSRRMFGLDRANADAEAEENRAFERLEAALSGSRQKRAG